MDNFYNSKQIPSNIESLILCTTFVRKIGSCTPSDSRKIQ